MKKWVFIGAMLLLSGCAWATYTGPDGSTITYRRFFAGSDSIKMTLGENKPSAEINKQTVDTELLSKALGLILGAAK